MSKYYQCDWGPLAGVFVQAANVYCPTIVRGDITPGVIGIRPKLFIDGKPYVDFLVENHEGFIHCLGMESPGLTASLACAEYVAGLIAKG